jgi:heme-degrading monooxygenase HmoA
MIVVSNRIQVAAGYEKEFENRFEGRARLVEKQSGFVRLEILRPQKVTLHGNEQGGSDYYVVLTYWQSAQDFTNWTSSDAFREAHSNRAPKEMFSGPNVFEMHEIIQLVEAKNM